MQEPITSVIISKHIFFGLMALFGGVVHSLIAHRKGDTKGFSDIIALAFISGFAGAMWTLLALIYYPDNIYAVGFAAGMGGFMSVEGLAVLINYIKQKLLNN